MIVVGTGLAGASAAATLAELGYNILNFFVFKIPLDEHTRLPPKVESMPPRTIKMMVTPYIVCSMTLLKGVTSALVNPMYTVWHKCL